MFSNVVTSKIYQHPRVFPLTSDLICWICGISAGAFLKLASGTEIVLAEVFYLSILAVLGQILIGFSNGVYRSRWRVTSYLEVINLTFVWVIVGSSVVAVNYWFRQQQLSELPSSGLVTGVMAAALLMGFSRGVWRTSFERIRRPIPENSRPTIVFGAGEGGAQILRVMLRDPESGFSPVALLDDDPHKARRSIEGIEVAGTRRDLAAVAEETGAEVLILAATSADRELVSHLATAARKARLDFRVLPPPRDFVAKMTMSDIRPPTIDDLLGRTPVDIDVESVSDYIRGKRVLITGAGGSIGSELSRQVHSFDPGHLFLVDRDETGLQSVQLALEGHGLLDSEMLVVADIRDRDRMLEVFDHCRPDVVFHAAALKHLTLLENHPGEGVKTNTLGTANVLDAAEQSGVDFLVNVSTDKAADPSSVLGATKLAAERLTAIAAQRSGKCYVSVRFGNVLGSRGSVLPTFYEQIRLGKPLTVTDRDATRFFMTIPEAARLVVQAGAIGKPGEVMILDMGEPVKIYDLAQQLVDTLSPNSEIVETGLRPGEKLHEVLVATEEVRVVRQHERITHTSAGTHDLESAIEPLREYGLDDLGQTLLASTRFARQAAQAAGTEISTDETSKDAVLAALLEVTGAP